MSFWSKHNTITKLFPYHWWGLHNKKLKYYYKIFFTFTSNNIFVNFCDFYGNTILIKTFGLIGYNGRKRKTYYAVLYYGYEMGILLTELLFNLTYGVKKKQREKALRAGKKIPKVALFFTEPASRRDVRYRRFMKAFSKYKIKFTEIFHRHKASHSTPRLVKRRRARRHLKYYYL